MDLGFRVNGRDMNSANVSADSDITAANEAHFGNIPDDTVVTDTNDAPGRDNEDDGFCSQNEACDDEMEYCWHPHTWLMRQAIESVTTEGSSFSFKLPIGFIIYQCTVERKRHSILSVTIRFPGSMSVDVLASRLERLVEPEYGRFTVANQHLEYVAQTFISDGFDYWINEMVITIESVVKAYGHYMFPRKIKNRFFRLLLAVISYHPHCKADDFVSLERIKEHVMVDKASISKS